MAVGIAIIVVFVAVLLLMAAAPMLVVLRVQPARDMSNGGACGKCGYNVRGIESLACPECGADLREVGITGTVRPRTGLFVGASAVWLFAMSVLALAAGLVLAGMRELPSGNPSRAAAATWIVLCTLLLTTLACVAGVVWMHRRTQASGAALTGVLLIWGFCMTALLLAVGGVRF